MFFIIYSIYRIACIGLAIKFFKMFIVKEKISSMVTIVIPFFFYFSLNIGGPILIETLFAIFVVLVVILIINRRNIIILSLTSINLVELITIHVPTVLGYACGRLFAKGPIDSYEIYFLTYKIYG